MKTKKTLKFSKETVALLDKTAKKSINGGQMNRIDSFTCYTYTPNCLK
ncbi:hypothetical protein [Chryseobacterium sp. c4a]|nr:hypothetical protein [Chryseobacterium sp. c4a]